MACGNIFPSLCAMSKFPLFCKDTPPSRTQGLPKWPIFINYNYNNIFPNTVTLWGAGRGIRILTRVIWGQIQSLGLPGEGKAITQHHLCSTFPTDQQMAVLTWNDKMPIIEGSYNRWNPSSRILLWTPCSLFVQDRNLVTFFSFLSGVVGDRPKALRYARETLSLNYI